MGPLTPFDVDDVVLTVDDDQLLVVQGLVVQEDQDEELYSEELFCDMMQVEDAGIQVHYVQCIDVPEAVAILELDDAV